MELSIENLTKDLNIAKGDLSIKINAIEKNNKLMSELQSVNARAESLLKSVTAEKRLLELQIREAVEISERFK
jgi:hypothetical protein